MRPTPDDTERQFYDEGWNAFVDGRPYVFGTRAWRDGWMDASEAKATEHMGAPPKLTALMTEEQIKHMVNRFLGWRLPENFSPDAGISFKRTFNEHTAHPMKHEPTGTNLFDVTQAEAMVRHMLEGLPLLTQPWREGR